MKKLLAILLVLPILFVSGCVTQCEDEACWDRSKYTCTPATWEPYIDMPVLYYTSGNDTLVRVNGIVGDYCEVEGYNLHHISAEKGFMEKAICYLEKGRNGYYTGIYFCIDSNKIAEPSGPEILCSDSECMMEAYRTCSPAKIMGYPEEGEIFYHGPPTGGGFHLIASDNSYSRIIGPEGEYCRIEMYNMLYYTNDDPEMTMIKKVIVYQTEGGPDWEIPVR